MADRRSVKSGNRKHFFFYLRLSVLVITFLVLLYIVDFSLVFIYIRNIPWYILIVLILIGLFRTWLTGLRWQVLNPDISGQLSRRQYFCLLMMAKPFNLIMPGALGGDVIRSVMTVNAVKEKKIDNVLAIIADRFIGLFSIVILGTLAFILSKEIPDKSAFYAFFIVVYSAIIMVLVFLTNSYLNRAFEKVTSRMGNIGVMLNNVAEAWQNALSYFKTNKKNVVMGLLLCIPIHVVSFFTAYLLALSLSINISFFDISLIIALVWLITAIPISISGVGVRELSMIYLFSIYGIDAEPATALSIFLYIVTVIMGLLGLLFFVDWKKLSQLIKLRLE